MSDEDMAQYRELQAKMQELLLTRQQFAHQDTENQLVKRELELSDADAAVYKQIGPLLLQQELGDVTDNVKKRLEFIAGEIEKVDRQLEAKQVEQKALVEKIQGLQQDLRAKAAEEARKVYEEQTGGTIAH